MIPTMAPAREVVRRASLVRPSFRLFAIPQSEQASSLCVADTKSSVKKVLNLGGDQTLELCTNGCLRLGWQMWLLRIFCKKYFAHCSYVFQAWQLWHRLHLDLPEELYSTIQPSHAPSLLRDIEFLRLFSACASLQTLFHDLKPDLTSNRHSFDHPHYNPSSDKSHHVFITAGLRSLCARAISP
jgi:hypothetical protein